MKYLMFKELAKVADSRFTDTAATVTAECIQHNCNRCSYVWLGPVLNKEKKNG